MSSTPEDEGERGRLAEAKEFLRDLLRAGPEFTGRIKAEAKEAEIGWRTVERAKAELKVQAVKHPDSGKWQWTLSGPTEEGDEEGASSPRQSEHGGDGGDGGLRGSAERPPSMAEMAGFDFTTTTTTENKAYIREDRQDRQDRQGGNDNRRGDENSTPPSDSANVGGHTFHRDPTAYEETF